MPRSSLALLIALAAGFVSPVAAHGQLDTVGKLIDDQTLSVIRHDPELHTLLGIAGDGIDLSGQLTDVSLSRRASASNSAPTSAGTSNSDTNVGYRPESIFAEGDLLQP